MDENEVKRQALRKLLSDNQDSISKVLTGDPSKHIDWTNVAETLGASGANMSDIIPGLDSLYKPKDSVYQGGGVSENKLGMPLTVGQPDMLRKAGPLDPTPAELAGTTMSIATDPYMLVNPAQMAGLSVKKIARYPSLQNLFKSSPQQAQFIEERLMKDPHVREVLLERRAPNSMDTTSNAANIDYSVQTGVNKDILEKLKKEALERGVQEEITKKVK